MLPPPLLCFTKKVSILGEIQRMRAEKTMPTLFFPNRAKEGNTCQERGGGGGKCQVAGGKNAVRGLQPQAATHREKDLGRKTGCERAVSKQDKMGQQEGGVLLSERSGILLLLRTQHVGSDVVRAESFWLMGR